MLNTSSGIIYLKDTKIFLQCFLLRKAQFVCSHSYSILNLQIIYTNT